VGPQGPIGITGSTGATGSQGIQGLKGDKGETGTAGTDGKTVLNGTAEPTAGVGSIGDFYLKTDSYVMYGPKSSEGWGAGTSLANQEYASGLLSKENQIAMKIWGYSVPENIHIGGIPRGLAFDGRYLWVIGDALNKIDPATGVVVGGFTFGQDLRGIAFDGQSLWVSSKDNNKVYKVRPNDGHIISEVEVGALPIAVAVATYKGNVYAMNHHGGTVSRISNDGTVLGHIEVGGYPTGIASDGVSIWVATDSDHKLTRIRDSDGVVIGRYDIGNNPRAIAYDGINIWVVNVGDYTMQKINTDNGSIMESISIGMGARVEGQDSILFTGNAIYITDANGSIKVFSSGTLTNSFTIAGDPRGLGFDGANVWVGLGVTGDIHKMK
jgi:hypothetical protein